jgi:hypothetical protein
MRLRGPGLVTGLRGATIEAGSYVPYGLVTAGEAGAPDDVVSAGELPTDGLVWLSFGSCSVMAVFPC